jgi:hypothetical protein
MFCWFEVAPDCIARMTSRKTRSKLFTFAIILFVTGALQNAARAQQASGNTSVLHIQQSVTTHLTGFPQFIYTYHLLNGAESILGAQAVKGTISIANNSANFSEVLWLLVYWPGSCPVDDQGLAGANFIWSDILKNPTQSDSKFSVDLKFPNPLPMNGCVGFVFGGGPLVQGAVTMSADLNLTYETSSAPPNTVVDLAGEYCFGQVWGCQNAITDDGMGFAVPITMQTSGHLAELFGNISDSTFDGTANFGPPPTGDAWGAINDFYLLPGGCGQFAQNINNQGFPNPAPLETLYSWLPPNATHLESVPMHYEIPEGETGIATLQKPVQRIFPVPLTVNSGDCIVVIYGRTGNGATDNETQVKALLTP